MEVRRVPFGEQSREEALDTARRYTSLIGKLNVTLGVEQGFIGAVRDEFKGMGAVERLSSLKAAYERDFEKERSRVSENARSVRRTYAPIVGAGALAYALGLPMVLETALVLPVLAEPYAYVQRRRSERLIGRNMPAYEEVCSVLAAAELALNAG